jgi:site-specific DNA-cytosine methylase
MSGKRLNFNDPRSQLFFEFVRCKNEVKPKYFLLENVGMKKEFIEIMNKYLKEKPQPMNSNLVSAQNRQRNYWCNWKVPKLDDLQIFWKDIQLENAQDVMYYSEAAFNWLRKSPVRFDKYREYTNKSDVKMQMLEASHSKGYSNQRCFGIVDNGYTRYIHPIECERLQTLPDNYTAGVSNTQRYKMLGNGWTVKVISHIFKNIPN